MFFRHICWSTHSHTHSKFHMLWWVFVCVFLHRRVSFLCFFFLRFRRAREHRAHFLKIKHEYMGAHKANASAFHLYTRIDSRQNSTEEKVIIWTVWQAQASWQACAHGYFIDDMMFYAFEIIPFHLHDTLFVGSKCFSCESKRFGRTCVLIFCTKKYGYAIIFRRTKKKIIRYTQRAMQAPFRPRSHLGFEYLP